MIGRIVRAGTIGAFIHRAQRGARAAATATGIVVAVAGLAASACGSPSAAARLTAESGPETGNSAGTGTPEGWAAVTYENAQLSVPASWVVESPQAPTCAFVTTGMIFAGMKPALPKDQGCTLTAGWAWIEPVSRVTVRGRPAAVIHGIPVYSVPAGAGAVQYLAPRLGVEVGADGSLARAILATLTRSPLSVALARGAATPVPSGWTWHSFGGLRFAAPRTWSAERTEVWQTCRTGLEDKTLLLLDAKRPPSYLGCPLQPTTAGWLQAVPGLTVVTGRYATRSVGESFSRCQDRVGVRICLSATTGEGGLLGSVLIISATAPHRTSPTYLLIGLSGVRPARTILDSVTGAQ